MAKWIRNTSSGDFKSMLDGVQMDYAMRRKAREVAARYKNSVPVESGALKSSVRVTTEKGGVKNDRRVGVVEVNSPHAAAVEFGNERNGGRGRHLLRRALKG